MLTRYSNKPEDTFELGRECAKKAKAGQVYCLNGDLGAGKTVFTKGFARGLGILDTVNSPTFTILNVYEEGRIPLYHIDAYRITDPDELLETGIYDCLDGDGVCLIEWASLIESILPPGCIQVTITPDLEKGFDYRRIEIEEERV